MPYVARDNINVYYEHWSYPVPRRTITLINGFGRPCTDFRSIGKHLVRAGFAVVTLDSRGVGRSQVTTHFSLADLCADVAAVWDYLGIKSSAVLGISMGGAVAQLLALQFPDRVTRLVLVSSFPDRSFAITEHKRRWDSLAAVEASLANYVAPAFYRNNRPLLTAMAKQMWQKRVNANATLQQQAISNFNNRERLTQISCPTLVVHGGEDRIIDPQAAAVLATTIPTAKLCLLPQAGHLLLIEKATELREQVVAFCMPPQSK